MTYLTMKGFNKQIIPVTTPGIYHSPDLGLISLSSNGSDWITIADKNVGATQVYNNGDALTNANRGKYFQRGNNYGFDYKVQTNVSSTRVNAQNYGPNNPYSSSTFIICNTSTYRGRDSSNNLNLRGGGSDTEANNWGLDILESTKINRRGPCAEGYHVPCGGENQKLLNTLTGLIGGTIPYTTTSQSQINQLLGYLKMGFFGMIIMDNSGVYDGSLYMWSSSGVLSSGSYRYSCSRRPITCIKGTSNTYYLGETITTVQGAGAVIRPFKNDSVAPDNTWTVLYQP